MAGLQLWFANKNNPSLDRILFWSENGRPIISIRSKSLPSSRSISTFQWGRPVQALAMLILRYKIVHGKLNFEEDQAILAGGGGSAAHKIYEAMCCKAAWLVNIFGCDANGTPQAMTLFHHSSLYSYKQGSVIISVNAKFITSGNILVHLQNRIVTDNAELRDLLSSLERQWNGNVVIGQYAEQQS